MKILAPFNQSSMIDIMAGSGVKEFYMGFYDEKWLAEYGRYSDINRLSLFKDTANRYSIGEIKDITEKIHKSGCELYITFNAPAYKNEQYEKLDQFINILSEYKIDGIITGVPDLIKYIKKYNMKAIASTMCGIYNSDMAMIYKDLGIDRIIFPRELKLKEIRSIINKVQGIEYEAFLMRNGCRYMDSNCLGLHGGECGALCSNIRKGKAEYIAADKYSYWMKNEIINTHEIYSNYFHEFTCGQCSIWELINIGVSAVKIVGRLDDMNEISADALLTKTNIENAEKCESKEEYLKKMEMPGDINEYCRNGLSCYYPESRFGTY